MSIGIRAENLSKLYQLGVAKHVHNTLSEQIIHGLKTIFCKQSWVSAQKESIWAIKDVSFEIEQGEVVGVVGRNGAGKSTLLKILSRVTEPTHGRAEIYGRVGSLLEVGTGFHPELSGRENIYLSGAVLGMQKAEISRKFDEIVAFAEVEKFLDTPVKRYSSGMYVRLAFAVAAHLEPEILLVDEVLAVGDAAFQKKCLGKMGEVAKGGRTILFVSHSMGSIRSLTGKCLYLKNGQLAAYDNTDRVVERYLMEVLEDNGKTLETDVDQYRRDPKKWYGEEKQPVHISAVRVNGESTGVPVLPLGSDFSIHIELEAAKDIHGAYLIIIIKDAQGRRVVVFFSWDDDFSLFLLTGKHLAQLNVGGLSLAPGTYFADFIVSQAIDAVAYDVIRDFPLLKVTNNGKIVHWLDRPWGSVHGNRLHWEIEKLD